LGEVQQRILGIRQGIDILRREVAERAAAAAIDAPDITSQPLDDASSGGPATTPAPAAADVGPLQTRSEISGNLIDVRLERDGEIVSRAHAAISLRNLLEMVFTNTPREGGDVPFAVGDDGSLFAPGEAARETVRTAAGETIGPNPQPSVQVSPDWVVVTR